MSANNQQISKNKGINVNINSDNSLHETDNSESETARWRSPSNLKEEVQTIIDIMGPQLSPNFNNNNNNNTSSDADNEESIFSNSKFSSIKCKDNCNSELKTNPPLTSCCSLSKDDDDDNDNETACSRPSTVIAELNTTARTSNDSNCNINLMDLKENSAFRLPSTNDVHYICPPPLFPANIDISSECICPQMATMLQNNVMPSPELKGINQKGQFINKNSKLFSWIKGIASYKYLGHDIDSRDCNEFYKMNIKRRRGDEQSLPRRVVFELVPGIPTTKKLLNHHTCKCASTLSMKNHQRHCCCTSIKQKKNKNNEKIQETNNNNNNKSDCCKQSCAVEEKELIYPLDSSYLRKPVEETTYCDDTKGKTRVDVYYFDHGNFSHYKTTDAPPILLTEDLAGKIDKHTTRFWAEIFGTIHVGFSFVTSFILQFFRFLLYSICRPLTIGLLQLASDYLFKPLLATLFNGIIQPVLIFIFNIATSVRDLCDPIAEGIGYFLREIAAVLRAIRLVDVNKCNETADQCENVKRIEKKKAKIIC